MSSLTLSADPPTMVLGLLDAPGPATATTTGLESLLFGLGLAVALPPAALLSPTDVGRLTVLPTARPMLGGGELGRIVGGTPVEVSRGRIALSEVDRRLRGLVVVLDLYRTVGAASALVSVGVVSSERPAPDPGAAAPDDLWRLARATAPRHGVVRDVQLGGCRDAMSIGYGAVTVQLVWLADDCLASVGVTSLDGDAAWIAGVARAIARHLDGRLPRP
jgi:hypothetical protein